MDVDAEIRAVPLFQEWYETDDTDEESDQPDWCFFCTHVCHDDTRTPRFRRLQDFINRNYGFRPERVFYHLLQAYYNKHIRPFLKGDDHDRPWLRRAMHQHFRHHQPTGPTEMFRDFQRLTALLEHIEKGGVLVHVPGRGVEVDGKMAGVMLKVMSERKRVIERMREYRISMRKSALKSRR